MANGTHINVKIKLEHDEYSQRSSSPQETEPWICHICDRTIHPSKKRCGSCQSWRGGTRIVAGSDAPLEELSQATDSVKEVSHTSEQVEDDKREDDDRSVRERLPKRKRTNFYSSLSPAAIEATAKARAEAYALAPPSPQRLSRPSKKNQSNDKNDNLDPAQAFAAEAAGHDIKEFIGQDGNLFYCFICLGVGEVVCCDGCPHVFHPACLPPGPSKASLENDDDPWYCHECVANRKATKSRVPSTKKRKRVKERCSECGRKETKVHPCITCSNGICNNFIHPVCPGLDDDSGSKFSSRRTHCTTCKTNGSYFNQVLSPRDGRGISVKGRGGHILLRMSSSEERKRRSTMESEDQSIYPIQGKNRVYSSGFQAPFVESDDDEDNEFGTKSLAYVEKPLSSIPGFFFFLLHNRSTIERSLSRKNPSFRKLARGTARNEKSAEAAAALWIDLSPNERNKWIEMSMKDFEQRVVAWKQQEVIQAMIKSMDEYDQDSQRERFLRNASHLPPDDSSNNAGPATNQVPKVGENRIRNRILLELLHDARYHPLPLVDVTKPDEDAGQRKESVNIGVKMTVQQFETEGPIATSLGDDCLGCTRGWNHFCSVLKRPIPGCSRAKLQPPVRISIVIVSSHSISLILCIFHCQVTSWTATRIGLGLRVNLLRELTQQQQPAENVSVGLGISEICPNFQPRDDLYLLTPSLRLDDTTEFVERVTALKHMQTINPVAKDHKHVESRRGPSPSRGSKETLLDEKLEQSGCKSTRQRHKCGTCGVVQANVSECYNCHISQLITQMATRRVSSQDATIDCSPRQDGCVKPTCSMLGRSNRSETITGCRNLHRDGLNRIGISLTKETWTPNVILPPKPKSFPSPKSQFNYVSKTEQFKSGCLEGVNDSSWNCNSPREKCSSDSKCVSCQRRKGGLGGEEIYTRPRSRTSKSGNGEPPQDRNALALKHKYDANELSRKCLTIACSGVLVGMVRRDPLGLFAEPVPADVEEYHQEIKDPIDCSSLRQMILTSKHSSLGAFIADARRLWYV
jgi:hypothetical protein